MSRCLNCDMAIPSVEDFCSNLCKTEYEQDRKVSYSPKATPPAPAPTSVEARDPFPAGLKEAVNAIGLLFGGPAPEHKISVILTHFAAKQQERKGIRLEQIVEQIREEL